MATSSCLLSSRAGGLLTVTLNRPDRGNAIDAPTAAALIAEFDDLSADPGDVRAVLLRGAGRHFCTGADLGTGSARTGDQPKPSIGHMIRSLGHGPHRVIEAVFGCPLPIVVELSGRTSGMGLHLALCCDFTVAASSSTFSEPFTERGFSVDSGGSWLLPRLVGLTRAKQLLYRGGHIDATTAHAWGLVSEVVEEDHLGERARELAVDLAHRATAALSTTKQLLHQHLTGDLTSAMRAEASAIELTIRSDDFKEGMRAFADKRAPRFTGR